MVISVFLNVLSCASGRPCLSLISPVDAFVTLTDTMLALSFRLFHQDSYGLVCIVQDLGGAVVIGEDVKASFTNCSFRANGLAPCTDLTNTRVSHLKLPTQTIVDITGSSNNIPTSDKASGHRCSDC